MKILLTIAALALVPMTSMAAVGGLFFEPGITYQMVDTTVNYGAPLNNSTGKNNGLGIMARLGFHVADTIFIGLDGRYAMTKFEDSAVNTNVDAKTMNVGPFVGIQMPIVGLRVWGSYVLMGDLDPDKVTDTTFNYDAKFTEAKGYRLGVGFHFLMVSLNLEYEDLKYDNATVDVFGGTIQPKDATSKGWIAGVSFPFDF